MLERRAGIGKALAMSGKIGFNTRRKTERMTAAILFAFASAAFLGAAVVTSQLGLRTIDPLSGAAVSVPAFTLLFLLLSPILLAGEPVVWRGLPIFAAIGLFFPAKTPAAIVQRWQAEVAHALQGAAVVEALGRMGGVPLMLGGARFDDFITAERSKWETAVRRSGAAVN